MTSLQELFVDQLRDIYSAENQLVKALPKVAKKASSDELRNAVTEHLEQTRGHVQRLEAIFNELGVRAKGKTCHAMEGLIDESKEIMEEFEEAVLDAGLIAAAQKVEHYEIAMYGSLKTWARLLGNERAAQLLEETLEEEKETNQALTDLAESSINTQALEPQTA